MMKRGELLSPVCLCAFLQPPLSHVSLCLCHSPPLPLSLPLSPNGWVTKVLVWVWKRRGRVLVWLWKRQGRELLWLSKRQGAAPPCAAHVPEECHVMCVCGVCVCVRVQWSGETGTGQAGVDHGRGRRHANHPQVLRRRGPPVFLSVPRRAPTWLCMSTCVCMRACVWKGGLLFVQDAEALSLSLSLSLSFSTSLPPCLPLRDESNETARGREGTRQRRRGKDALSRLCT